MTQPNGTVATLAGAVEDLTREVQGLRDDLASRTRRLWRWVTGIAVGVALVGGSALTLIYLLHAQSGAVQDEVDRALADSARNARVIDATRVPLCGLIYPVLANPLPPTPTASQLALRREYRAIYGPGTAEQPGLNCPRQLPEEGAGE